MNARYICSISCSPRSGTAFFPRFVPRLRFIIVVQVSWGPSFMTLSLDLEEWYKEQAGEA